MLKTVSTYQLIDPEASTCIVRYGVKIFFTLFLSRENVPRVMDITTVTLTLWVTITVRVTIGLMVTVTVRASLD